MPGWEGAVSRAGRLQGGVCWPLACPPTPTAAGVLLVTIYECGLALGEQCFYTVYVSVAPLAMGYLLGLKDYGVIYLFAYLFLGNLLFFVHSGGFGDHFMRGAWLLVWRQADCEAEVRTQLLQLMQRAATSSGQSGAYAGGCLAVLGWTAARWALCGVSAGLDHPWLTG